MFLVGKHGLSVLLVAIITALNHAIDLNGIITSWRAAGRDRRSRIAALASWSEKKVAEIKGLRGAGLIVPEIMRSSARRACALSLLPTLLRQSGQTDPA